MIKFKYYRKNITQGFDENRNPLYKDGGLSGHTGIDWVQGYGEPVQCDNKGYIYKIFTPKNPASRGFTGVYQLVPMAGEYYMEILYGHLSKVKVKVGETVPEDLVIGDEGNNGDVYSGGAYYPEGHPNKGEKGHHVHEQYRIVKRVRNVRQGKHYLNVTTGRYRDDDGYYYEIVLNNSVRGCINPRIYDYHERKSETLQNLKNIIRYYLMRARGII